MRKIIILSFIFFSFTLLLFHSDVYAQTSSDWYMAGANPQRTSWVSATVGNASIEWYRPIEAFIDPKVQVIAAENKIFLATSNGLYVFDTSGNLLWRFNTPMPLGDAPTVLSNVVYISGYDHTIRTLNASTGTQMWMFDGAKAGFETNPLVVNSGNGLKVYAGSRDGYFYAINASNGSLAWQYPQANQNPLGPISFPAVYHQSNNRIYFASNDMYAYALDAGTGSLVSKSQKLPGEGFRSYWPVIYQDKLIIRGAPYYRNGIANNIFGVQDLGLGDYDDYVNGLERDDFFSRTEPLSTFTASSSNGPWPWVLGSTVLDGTRYQNYLAQKPVRPLRIHL